MPTKQLLSLALILGLLTPAAALAQWALNGNPICTATEDQDEMDITANGLGGAVMVWSDDRGGARDIYASQVAYLGAAEWPANGLALCTGFGFALHPHVVHDGYGYLLYTWEDNRSGTWDIYAAITDRLGNIPTPNNGFPICESAGAQQYSVLASNASYGMGFVAWTDARDGGNDIYAQAFNVNNYGFWDLDGLAFCTAAGDQSYPAIVADDPIDGAVIAWQDMRNGNSDIYAQRANLSNQLMWTADGVEVCTSHSEQSAPMIVGDGSDGVIIGWIDTRHGSGVGSIYAQKLNSLGAAQWDLDGVAIVVSTDHIKAPKMIADGAGGAIFVWGDDRNLGALDSDIYAQRVDGNGSVLWTVDGLAVCTAQYQQVSVDIAPDGTGGVVAAWQDNRGIFASLYAQRVTASGSMVWTGNGIPVSATGTGKFNVKLAQSDADATILAWLDAAWLFDSNVYAQRIDNDSGLYGYPQPLITSIVDTPTDEGGFVRLTFRQGDGQAPGEEYEIYNVDYHGNDVVYVGTFNGSPTYTVDVLTTEVDVFNTYWVSTYAFSSNLLAGKSLDNLAPPPPTLAGERNGNNVELSWNATAPDIDHYIMQRSDLGSFNVNGTAYVDVSVPMMQLNYRMNAVDIHGNVSNNSNGITIDAPTGIGETPSLPKALTLLPNSPNPFNASTALHVGMPKAGEVRLEVYDVAGRRVATRDVGQLSAGWREVVFDGRADSGKMLASGVYFYRVHAGGETHMRKMVISR